MTGLTVITWIRFVLWLAIGLFIYFLYSRRHSDSPTDSRSCSADTPVRRS